MRLARAPFIITPALLFSFPWLLVSVLSFIYNATISSYTDILIGLSIILFCVPELIYPVPGSFALYRFQRLYSPQTRKYISLIFACIVAVLLFYSFLLYEFDFGSLSSPLMLRNDIVNYERETGLPLIAELGVNLPIVSCLYIASTFKRFQYPYLFVCLIVALLGIAPILSKGYMITLFFSTLAILYIRGFVRARYFYLSLLGLVSLVLLLFLFRDSQVVSTEILFKMYTIAPLLALNQIVIGFMTLPLTSLSIPGFLNPRLIEESSIFCDSSGCWAPNLDVPTNVYTLFGFILSDYGIILTPVIFFALGVTVRLLVHFCIRRPSPPLLASLSLVFTFLLISFFSDGLYAGYLTNVKYISLLYFIWLCPSNLLLPKFKLSRK